jgi:DNA-binding transcriptional LysR family regulator
MALHGSRGSDLARPVTLPARLAALRLRHLELLHLIETKGTLRAAADALAVTQPAVTAMLHELESAFGATLVERTRSGSVLTSAGRALLGRAAVALNEIDAGRNAAQGPQPAPLLRIGALPLVSSGLLPDVLAMLRRTQPTLRFVLREDAVDELMATLAAGEVDYIISRTTAAGFAMQPALRFEPIVAERLVVACAADHPLRRVRALGRLHAAGWILPPPNTWTRTVLDGAFVRVGLAPPIPVVESASFHASLRIAAATDLVTVAPGSAFIRNRSEVGLCAMNLIGRPLGQGVLHLAYRSSVLEPPMLAPLLKALRKAAALGGWSSPLRQEADSSGTTDG